MKIPNWIIDTIKRYGNCAFSAKRLGDNTIDEYQKCLSIKVGRNVEIHYTEYDVFDGKNQKIGKRKGLIAEEV